MFKLGGKAVLPPYTPIPLDPPQPSSESFTPAQLATGARLYGQFCAICHRGPVNPDLRRSALLRDREAWNQVVIGGAFENNGMASFRDYMTPAEAEAIRGQVNRMALELQKEPAAH